MIIQFSNCFIQLTVNTYLFASATTIDVQLVTRILFLSCMFLQSGVYCYFGDHLTNKVSSNTYLYWNFSMLLLYIITFRAKIWLMRSSELIGWTWLWILKKIFYSWLKKPCIRFTWARPFSSFCLSTLMWRYVPLVPVITL